VLKIFFSAFTSYSGLIVALALNKCTAAHKYWILENWLIARLCGFHFLHYTSKSFLLFLNGCGSWCNPLKEKRRTRNERIKFAALSYFYRSAKFDTFINFFAPLFILPFTDVRNFSDWK